MRLTPLTSTTLVNSVEVITSMAKERGRVWEGGYREEAKEWQ